MAEENTESKEPVKVPLKEKLKAKPKSVKGGGKRGALSIAEMDFIKTNGNILDIKQISEQIGKSVDTIRKYAYKANITIKDKDGQDGDIRFVKLRKLLRTREYWPETQKQFSPEEIKIFEDTWVKIVIQFDEDVIPTEELQITKHITLEIIKNRFLQKMYNIEKQIFNIQITVDEEYAKAADKKNIEAIRDLNSQIEKLQTNQILINKEVNAIVDKQKDTEKALKGSRDQRVKEFVDAEKNWVNVVRVLENSEVRDQIGKHIEIMKAAQEFQEMKLYDYHTFADGTLDRLVLNSESVALEGKDDE